MLIRQGWDAAFAEWSDAAGDEPLLPNCASAEWDDEEWTW
jgi:hypothetical protein